MVVQREVYTVYCTHFATHIFSEAVSIFAIAQLKVTEKGPQRWLEKWHQIQALYGQQFPPICNMQLSHMRPCHVSRLQWRWADPAKCWHLLPNSSKSTFPGNLCALNWQTAFKSILEFTPETRTKKFLKFNQESLQNENRWCQKRGKDKSVFMMI